jgi:hypothetical protein
VKGDAKMEIDKQYIDLGDFVFAPKMVKKFRTNLALVAEKKSVQSVEVRW